jgi:hypothetical protein
MATKKNNRQQPATRDEKPIQCLVPDRNFGYIVLAVATFPGWECCPSGEAGGDPLMAVWDSAKQVQSSHSHPWLAWVIFALDTTLRRRLAVVEYTADPSCIFRLGIAHSLRALTLRDGTRLQAGDRVVELHFWNEHVPSIPPNGTTIRWAREAQQSIKTSLSQLAQYLSSRPELRDIRVICANVPSGTKAQSQQVARIMAYFGFEAFTEHERLSVSDRIHRFGENILISLTVLARNAPALRLDTLWRVRVPIYLSRRTLEKRFGSVN